MKRMPTEFIEYISHQELRYILNVIKLSSITLGLVSLRNVKRNPKHKNHENPSVCMDGQTDMTVLIVTFRSCCTNAP
jgi:hypothetical protein